MKPLSALGHLRVLDLTRLLPGPFCTGLLADLGAEVIKVEDPAGGDYLRHMPPLARNTNAQFLALNRGKRSITLDLRNDAGRVVLNRLLERCDILVEGFRPGVLDRLGFGPEALRARLPRLIYASITGYGHTGPYRDRAGHDLNYCSLAGAAGLTGTASGKLAIPGFQPADLSGALYLTIGILVAVVRRERTGEGVFLDVAMTDCIRALNIIPFTELFQTGSKLGPAAHVLNGGMVLYNFYRTKDGRYMSLGAIEPKFWLAFCRAVGKEHLMNEMGADAGPDSAVKRELDALFASRTQAEWTEFFAAHDCCCEPVLSLDEAAEHPLAQAREAIRHTEHPTEGPQRQLNQPLRFDPPVAADTAAPAPMQGEHTEAVLREAGFSADELAEFRKHGAFGPCAETKGQ